MLITFAQCRVPACRCGRQQRTRGSVLAHLAGIGVDPLAAIDVLARGALKTEAGFVVVELEGVLLDFPMTLVAGPPALPS